MLPETTQSACQTQPDETQAASWSNSFDARVIALSHIATASEVAQKINDGLVTRPGYREITDTKTKEAIYREIGEQATAGLNRLCAFEPPETLRVLPRSLSYQEAPLPRFQGQQQPPSEAPKDLGARALERELRPQAPQWCRTVFEALRSAGERVHAVFQSRRS